jgi:putative spermidine/putrescine transport system substrate-binding protein
VRRVIGPVVAAIMVGGAVALVPHMGNAAHPTAKLGGDLNIVAWEGYTDPSFVKPFEQQTGCTIHSTYAGSSNEMFSKFRSGGGTTYDLVSASGDASLRFIRAGVVAPVDVGKIPNWKQLAPQLKSPPHNTVNGKHYGVSFMWGPDVLIYNTKDFKTAPTSWNVLYNPKYKGKITIPDNPEQIADAAVYLHYKQPYSLSDAQLAKIKALLQRQRPLVRHYWGLAGDFESLFKNHEVILGAGWPLMTVDLKAAGVPVAETIPREGATGWADTWMLSTRSHHTACAYAWMNYSISAPVQKQVVAVTHYSPANIKTAQLLGPKQAKALHITDTKYFNSIRFWQSPPNFDKWVTLWAEVKG